MKKEKQHNFFAPDTSIEKVKGKPKPIQELSEVKMWCYIAPNGEIQTRSLMETKKLARWAISFRERRFNGDQVTFEDYEKMGFRMVRVLVTVSKVTKLTNAIEKELRK